MFEKLKKSFSTRLAVYIITVCTISFIAIFAAIVVYSRTIVSEEASHRAEILLKDTEISIDTALQSIELSLATTAADLDLMNLSPDSLNLYTERLIRSNPMITGCGIALEPNYFKEKGRYFFLQSLSVNEGEIETKQRGSDDDYYFAMDWYIHSKRSKKAVWSEPYSESEDENNTITSYSRPLIDKNGCFFGVIRADVSMKDLDKMMRKTRPYIHSFTFALAKDGKYIIHPADSLLNKQTIFTHAVQMGLSHITEIGQSMIGLETGWTTLKVGIHKSYVFYMPLKRLGWSIALVCPYIDVFAALYKMYFSMLIIGIIGLILLFVISYKVIDNMTQPLYNFAKSAREIAHGNFETKLPEIKSEDEMKLLSISFAHMRNSLVNYIEELKCTTSAKERIESELRIASEIQMGMVPKIFPPFPERNDIDLYAALKPAKEVGGDLYDFFIHDEKLYFAVGDVSGKGVPASLLMAVTRSLFRSVAAHLADASLIVKSINNAIAESNETNMFVTIFIGVLDLNTRVLDYCNAGHNPPIFIGNGETQFIDVIPNIPVGIFEGYEFKAQTRKMPYNSMLFVYTDGLSEAENISKDMFGDDRMLKLLSLNENETAVDLTKSVINAVNVFVADAPQSDDITILTLKIEENEEAVNNRK